jgi:hypothetical protein
LQTSRNKEEIKSLIIATVTNEKLENVEQLKHLLRQKYALSPEVTEKIIIELENSSILKFKPSMPVNSAGIQDYLMGHQGFWYLGTMAFCLATITAILTISTSAYPLIFLRSALGIIFVLFLPGYAFIRACFPVSTPLKTLKKSLDGVERIVLSLGMSLAMVAIVGLVFNYTPWGISLIPMTLSLLILTIFFATTAIIRESKKLV